MIVKGHEGHVISVSTVFKVHYNQKLGDPLYHLGGGNAPWPLGGIDAPAYHLESVIFCSGGGDFRTLQ